MTRSLLFALLALSVPLVANGQELDFGSFGSTPLSQAEFERQRVPIGKGPGGTIWGIPSWVHIDGVGLSAAAKTRLENALDCSLEETPTRLTVATCAVRQAGLADDWFPDVTPQPRYVGFAVIEYTVWQYLNWCSGNGTCSQSGRFALLGSDWSHVADFPTCLSFFPPRPLDTDGDDIPDTQRDLCGVAGNGKFLHDPPVTFLGVDPDRPEAP